MCRTSPRSCARRESASWVTGIQLRDHRPAYYEAAATNRPAPWPDGHPKPRPCTSPSPRRMRVPHPSYNSAKGVFNAMGKWATRPILATHPTAPPPSTTVDTERLGMASQHCSRLHRPPPPVKPHPIPKNIRRKRPGPRKPTHVHDEPPAPHRSENQVVHCMIAQHPARNVDARSATGPLRSSSHLYWELGPAQTTMPGLASRIGHCRKSSSRRSAIAVGRRGSGKPGACLRRTPPQRVRNAPTFPGAAKW